MGSQFADGEAEALEIGFGEIMAVVGVLMLLTVLGKTKR